MRDRIIAVPNSVRQKATTLGAEGLTWLTNLDTLIRDLEQDWQISVGGPGLEGGSEAYVAKATTRNGLEVILKVAMPEMHGNTLLAHEVSALTIADGHGYVRLLQHDLSRRALLLERLGAPLKDLGYSTRAQIEIICTTLKESWIRVPPGSRLQSGADAATGLSKFIAELWEKLDRPCSKLALDMALSFAQTRAAAFNPQTAVLVHGDAHSGNTLQNLSRNSPLQSPFKLIDPDGLVAEPAYDLSILMREWTDELIADPLRLGRERCAYLSHLTSVDTQAIWEWGFIQCMSTGLFLMQIGQKQSGSQMLNVAEAWAGA